LVKKIEGILGVKYHLEIIQCFHTRESKN
jgi:hypothetical protein